MAVLGDLTPDQYKPTVADVSALLRARTKDSNGREIGIFSEDTRPTDAQVDLMIDTAVEEVLVNVGPGPPDWMAMGIKSVSTIKAAMLIELSYFPEQVGSERSPYSHYARLYEAEIRALQDAARGIGPGGITTFSARIPVWGEELVPEPEPEPAA